MWERLMPGGPDGRACRWVNRPLLCKLGRHRWDANHWGFGGAVVDWYCPGCSKQIGWTALDDVSRDARERIAAAMEILGATGIGSPVPLE